MRHLLTFLFLSVFLIVGATPANGSAVIDFSDIGLGVDGFYEGPPDFYSGNATFNANVGTYRDYWWNYAASSWDSDMSTVDHPLWTTDSGLDHTASDDNHMGLFYPGATRTGTDRITFDTIVYFEEIWFAKAYDTTNSYPGVGQSVDVDAYDSFGQLLYSSTVTLDMDGAWSLFAPAGWAGVKSIELTNFANDPEGSWGNWVCALDDIKTKAVPIPGAVWLMGSGFLALMGIRRRKERG